MELDIAADRKLRCHHCAIRHHAVCGALSDDELAGLSVVARQRMVKAGDVIMNAEEETVSFANIVSGVVKLTKLLSDGRQQIVGLQFPPDFLGRAYRARSPYFAEAATDVELCVFPRPTFQKLLADRPGLESRLFQDTLDELDAAREWMLLLGRKTAAEKVASFLAMIARRQSMATTCVHLPKGSTPTQGPITLHLPLTRAEAADYLGLTIETVSRQIGKLRADGVLKVGANREIAILDMERLEELAEL
ncbi:MAG: Crp/Fnr family transcriptional regulator [Alphaproteobacteria bacterium]